MSTLSGALSTTSHIRLYTSVHFGLLLLVHISLFFIAIAC